MFLDELPEFGAELLNALRQPISNREIAVSRVRNSVTYPADFLLVAAANPCPCGYYPNRLRCACSSAEIKKYQRRIPVPILDRLPIRVSLHGMNIEEIFSSILKTKNYILRDEDDWTCGVAESFSAYGETLFDDRSPHTRELIHELGDPSFSF